MRLRVHCKAGHSLPGSHGRNQRGYTEALLRSVRKFKQAKRVEKSHPAKHRNPPKALPLPPTSIEHILHYGHLASTLAQRPAGHLRMDSRAHHPDRGGCQSGSASRSFLIRWDGHLGDHAYVRHGHVRHGIDAPALPPRLRPPILSCFPWPLYQVRYFPCGTISQEASQPIFFGNSTNSEYAQE